MRAPGRHPGFEWERRDTALTLQALAVALLAAACVAAWAAHAGWHLGASASDTTKGIWGVWWTAFPQARAGDSLWFSRMLYFPIGTRFLPPDPANVLAIAPLARHLGAPAAYTFLLVFQLLFGTVAGFVTLRCSGASRTGAAVGALVFGLAPYQWCNLQEGLSECATIAWLALFAASWMRLAERPTAGGSLRSVAVYAVMLLTNLYYAVFGLMFAVLWGGLTWRRCWRNGALLLLLVTLIALGVTSLTAQSAMGAVYRNAGGIKQGWVAPGEDLRQLPPLNSFIGTSPAALLRRLPPPTVEQRQGRIRSEYLGLTVLVLALLGFAAAPREGLPWVAVGAAFALLALGTGYTFAQRALVPPAMQAWLPFPGLIRVQPILAMMNFPYRAVIMVNLAAAVLVGRGTDRLLAGLPPMRRAVAASAVAFWILLDFYCFSGAPLPPATTRPAPAPYARWLRAAPGAGAVLDLPLAAPELFDWMSEYVGRQMEHCRPIPYSFGRQLEMLGQLGFEPPPGEGRGVGQWPRGPGLRQACDVLRSRGFGWIVLHTEWFRATGERVALASLEGDLRMAIGPPRYRGDHHRVYRIPAGPGEVSVRADRSAPIAKTAESVSWQRGGPRKRVR